MSKRVCAEPNCPALIDAGTRDGRCATHRRARDKARGTRQQRGYGSEHTDLRADYQRRMDQGECFVCWRPECDRVINPRAWHLGHDDHDRSVYRGPECPACNLATSGRKASARQVTVVCGPPCSGKTTWVRERAQGSDLIVDYDDIAQRLGSRRTHGHHPRLHKRIEATIARAIEGVRQGRHERAWIIRSGVERARELANELGGTLVVLDEPDDVLLERARRRPDAAAATRAIRAWRQANRISPDA